MTVRSLVPAALALLVVGVGGAHGADGFGLSAVAPSDWFIASTEPTVGAATATGNENSGGGKSAAPTEAVKATKAAKPAKAKQPELWCGDPAKFFGGAVLGLAGHEMGHVITNRYLGSGVHLTRVTYGFIPFFNIEPSRHLDRHEHYAVASAGFNAQNLTNEWLLTEHPNLKNEDDPFLKGWGMFNFWLSVGYAATGFAEYGPGERDTLGMAHALHWDERVVSAMVLAPAVLDYYRYNHPDCKWARDLSRILKLTQFGIAFGVH